MVGPGTTRPTSAEDQPCGSTPNGVGYACKLVACIVTNTATAVGKTRTQNPNLPQKPKFKNNFWQYALFSRIIAASIAFLGFLGFLRKGWWGSPIEKGQAVDPRQANVDRKEAPMRLRPQGLGVDWCSQLGRNTCTLE